MGKHTTYTSVVNVSLHGAVTINSIITYYSGSPFMGLLKHLDFSWESMTKTNICAHFMQTAKCKYVPSCVQKSCVLPKNTITQFLCQLPYKEVLFHDRNSNGQRDRLGGGGGGGGKPDLKAVPKYTVLYCKNILYG